MHQKHVDFMYNKVAVIMSRSSKRIVMYETIAQVIHICTDSYSNNKREVINVTRTDVDLHQTK